jgi:hypothetical protein
MKFEHGELEFHGVSHLATLTTLGAVASWVAARRV